MKKIIMFIIAMGISSLTLAADHNVEVDLSPRNPTDCKQDYKKSVNRTRIFSVVENDYSVDVTFKTVFFKCSEGKYTKKKLGRNFSFWTTNGFGNFSLNKLSKELIIKSGYSAMIRVSIDKTEIDPSRKFKLKLSRGPLFNYAWKVKVEENELGKYVAEFVE